MCSFTPRRSKTMVDLRHTGGTPVLLKRLLAADLLNPDYLTPTGQNWGENLAHVASSAAEQKLFAPLSKPFKPYTDMQICFGNLTSHVVVFKVSSRDQPNFQGQAICFENPRDMVAVVRQGRIQPGNIVELRNLGPVASGMPEVLIASAALAFPELDGMVVLISDTRVSAVSHGAIGVHCAPEAAVCGTIALVQDGDQTHFDLLAETCELQVDDEQLTTRRSQWQAPSPPTLRAHLADFSVTVAQANLGCVSKVLHR